MREAVEAGVTAFVRLAPREFGYRPITAPRQIVAVESGIRSDPADWSDERQRHGLSAEETAMQYLISRGWQILAHRFRAGRVEIDIIARQGSLVAFVEVKARRGTAFGTPFEAVTGPKRREIVKAARVWMDRRGRPGDVYRFDCIGIQDGELEHLADAFRPGWR